MRKPRLLLDLQKLIKEYPSIGVKAAILASSQLAIVSPIIHPDECCIPAELSCARLEEAMFVQIGRVLCWAGALVLCIWMLD